MGAKGMTRPARSRQAAGPRPPAPGEPIRPVQACYLGFRSRGARPAAAETRREALLFAVFRVSTLICFTR